MAIRINTFVSDANLVGRSHWWGAPDLPEDIPYPCVRVTADGESYDEPLTFVCQIRCRDIAGLDTENLLPHEGMLYFFAPIDYFIGNTDSPLDYHDDPVVIYSRQEDGLSPYELYWAGTDESVFAESEAMSFEAMDKEVGDGLILLGQALQDEVREQHPGKISLLQIDEDDRWGLRFYDCGMYYFMMKPEDIRKGLWQNCCGELYYY